MEALYHKTKSLIEQISAKIAEVEKATTNDELRSHQSDIKSSFNEIFTNFDKLDILVNKESAVRRNDAKLKVDQLKYDFKHYQTAFNTIVYRKEQKFLEEKRREELLNYSLNSNSNNQNHADTSILLDYEQNEMRHHNRMTNINRNLDEMIDHGENLVKGVKDQQDALKSIKTKILSIGNTLGVSQSILHLIQRRSANDLKIAFGLMILTLIIMFLCWKYLIK